MNNHIINQINNIYYKYLDEDTSISLITKYIYDKLKINKNLNYKKILNDDKILYNTSNNDYIIIQVIHNLNNNLLNKDNYNNYVNSIKFILSQYIKNNKYYNNGKNFNNNIQIYNLQYNYLINNINNLEVLPLEKPLNIISKIQNHKYIKGYKKLYYSFQDKKEFNDDMILYSYLCYFKTAINYIKHNSLFKCINNIESETLDIMIKEALTQKEIVGGNKCRDYKFYQIGGLLFIDLFTKDNVSIIEFVKLFNEMTHNKYLIGTPGIKYYPYQILLYIIDLFPYNIFNNIHILNLSQTIKKSSYSTNNLIQKYFISNEYCYHFITIQNDPMINNVFTIMYNKKLNYNEVKNETYKLLHSNIYQYQYKYIIDNYYLESICLIENISKNNNENLIPLDFYNIYIKFLYNENYKLINIIRYDSNVLEYNNINMNKYNFMKLEFNKLFHKNYVSDYINGLINYKISLVCYMNKNYKKICNELLIK